MVQIINGNSIDPPFCLQSEKYRKKCSKCLDCQETMRIKIG